MMSSTPGKRVSETTTDTFFQNSDIPMESKDSLDFPLRIDSIRKNNVSANAMDPGGGEW